MISEYINEMKILAESARVTLKDEKPKQVVWALRGRPIDIYGEDIPRMNLFRDIYESASPYNLMEPEIPMLIDIEKLIGDISDTKSEIIKIDKKFREDITNLRYIYKNTEKSILECINNLTNIRQENKRRAFFDIELNDFHFDELHHKELTLWDIMYSHNLLSPTGKSHAGLMMGIQIWQEQQKKQSMNRNPCISIVASKHFLHTGKDIIEERNTKSKSKYHN